MKTILKNLFFASLLLAASAASAQSELLEALPEMLQKEFGIKPKKSINQERDVQKEGRPLKSRCDIYSFTLTKKQQEKVFKGLKDCFESAGKDKNCYSVNSMNELTGEESLRNLIIGDDPNRYVTIGKDYNNYINVNILDAKDTTKTHRYAYALEWRETNGTSEKGAIDVRYIITYAKIPSAMPTVPGIINYNGSVKPFKYFEDNLDAQKRYEEFIKGIDPKKLQRLGDVRIQDKLSVSGDSAFVVVREVNGKPWKAMGGTINQAFAGENILLMFSSLKQYYQNHKNAELTAISIYSLCKHANEDGLFRDDSVEELEQMSCEVDKLIEEAKTETDRKYFQMAREQLEKILKSKK